MFSFDFDPSIRYTVWSLLIGYTLYWTVINSCLQTQAQRYLCVKDTKTAQRYVFYANIYVQYENEYNRF